jgi:transposase
MRAGRRSFTEEFRQQVVAETQARGASISSVALRHKLNANVVHKWRRRILGTTAVVTASPALLPIEVTATTNAMAHPIIEAKDCPSGSLTIELPKARIEVRGAVDLDILQTVLAVLRPR